MKDIKSLGHRVAFACALGVFLGPLVLVESASAQSPMVRPSWTGFYAGGNIGGTWSDYRLGGFADHVDIVQQYDQLFPFESPTFNLLPTPAFDPVRVSFPESDEVNGSFFGGGQLGYSYQWQRFVFGIEGDFDGLSTKEETVDSFSRTSAVRFNTAQSHGFATREASTDWNASVRVRLGLTYYRWLFYITAGPAFSELTGRADDVATTDFFQRGFPTGSITSTNSSSTSDVFTGWTTGIGADYRVARAVSIGFEYRYSNFGGNTFDFDNHGNAVHSGSTGIDMSSHQLTVRVNAMLSSLFGQH